MRREWARSAWVGGEGEVRERERERGRDLVLEEVAVVVEEEERLEEWEGRLKVDEEGVCKGRTGKADKRGDPGALDPGEEGNEFKFRLNAGGLAFFPPPPPIPVFSPKLTLTPRP